MGGSGQATTQGYSNVTTYTATGRSKGRSLGGYATWFSDPRMQTGLTLDGVILEASFDNAVSGAQLPTENYDSRNTQISIEADYAFALTAPGGVALYLQPQVQFTYFDLDTNPHLEANGTLVESRTEDLWQSRVGLRLYGHAETAQGSVVQPFAELDWLHGSDPDVLAFDGIVVEADTPQDRYALRGGLAFALSHGATVWAKFGIEDGADDYRSIEGGMGIRFDW
jgi:autotransporter family porin